MPRSPPKSSPVKSKLHKRRLSGSSMEHETEAPKRVKSLEVSEVSPDLRDVTAALLTSRIAEVSKQVL